MANPLRSAAFFVQRFMLGRSTTLAKVPDYGLELRVPMRDALGRHLYTDRTHTPATTHFLATGLDLQPDELVFDIGASVGWHALLLSRIAPRGVTIHAFEPDPWIRGLLQENASRNRAESLLIIGAAVGEHTGRARLYQYGARRRGPAGSVEVDMVSLDDYCERNELGRLPVGFIKLGIEGSELSALRGARATLARCRSLLTEFSPAFLEQADVHPASLLDMLVELGFMPFLLESDGPRPVQRAELLDDRAPRDVFWTRPAPRQSPAPPDPGALAI